MNFLDIILAIPLLWFAYKGFTKGFVIELATLAALLIGIFAAMHFSEYMGDFISKKFNFKKDYLSMISFSLTFILVVIAVILLGKVLEKIIKMAFLGFLNQIVGALFGILKIGFVLSVLIYFLNKIDPRGVVLKAEIKTASLLYKPTAALAPMIFPLLKIEKLKSLTSGQKI